jgi:hypothetical protein
MVRPNGSVIGWDSEGRELGPFIGKPCTKLSFYSASVAMPAI